MFKIFPFLFSIFISFSLIANDINTIHEIDNSGENNLITVKTTITGLAGVGIARLTYKTGEGYTFNIINKGSAMYSESPKGAKFYFLSVDPSGAIVVEFTMQSTTPKTGKTVIPVNFNYSKNEDRFDLVLPNLTFSNTSSDNVLTENNVKPEEPEITEEIIVTTTEPIIENVEPESESIVEENPVVEDIIKEESKPSEVTTPVASAEKPIETTTTETVTESVEQIDSPVVEVATAETKNTEEIVEEPEPIKETPIVETVSTPVSESNNSSKYSVQLFTLSNYQEDRLQYFCEQHQLSRKEMILKEVGSTIVVSYKKLNSKEEAINLRDKLRINTQTQDAFVVTID